MISYTMMLYIKVLLLCVLLGLWQGNGEALVSPDLTTNPPETDGQCTCTCATSKKVQEIVNQKITALEHKQESLYNQVLVQQTISMEEIKIFIKNLQVSILDEIHNLQRTATEEIQNLRVTTENELRILKSHIQSQCSAPHNDSSSKRDLKHSPTEASMSNTTDAVLTTDTVSTTTTKRAGNELAVTSTESLKGSYQYPVNSCKDITEGSPSGDYWVLNNCNKTPVKIYCDMTRSACNSTGGWTRVANLDMTNSSHQCPVESSTETRDTVPHHLCTRRPSIGCSSTIFQTHSISYSRVCGKIRGYQYGQPHAFYHLRFESIKVDLEGSYVDGISLTHGNPGARKHIWTFAAGADETGYDSWICPCTRTDLTFQRRVPSFVGQDYFCDTANHDRRNVGSVEFYDDPLWDGDGCVSTSSCCCFNSPPWFCKELPQPTTDDIELRICGYRSDSHTPLEIIELYIK